jgi:hypothetical protein
MKKGEIGRARLGPREASMQASAGAAPPADGMAAWGSARVPMQSSVSGNRDGKRKVLWTLGPAGAAVKSIALGLPHNDLAG